MVAALDTPAPWGPQRDVVGPSGPSTPAPLRVEGAWRGPDRCREFNLRPRGLLALTLWRLAIAIDGLMCSNEQLPQGCTE